MNNDTRTWMSFPMQVSCLCWCLLSLSISRNVLFDCASFNSQGREEGEVEVKDGQSDEVSGQIGEQQPDFWTIKISPSFFHP